MFTVGIDQAVNAGFLQRLAAAGGGRAELVESEDGLDEAMARIHRAVATPVATGLRVWSAGGITLLPDTYSPSRPADCFPGAPVVISVRYAGLDSDPPRVMVGCTPMVFAEEFIDVAVVDNPAVRATWARSHVRRLEDAYAVAPDEALAARIVATSLTHGVVSRFTAFVAVDPTRSDDDLGAAHTIVQPVEVPSGWAAPTMAGGAPMPMPMPMPLASMRSAHAPVGATPPMPTSAPAPELARPPEPTADWRAVWKEASALLRRIEGGKAGADEVDVLVARLEVAGAPDALLDALEALAAALRQSPDDAARRRRLVAAVAKRPANAPPSGGDSHVRGRKGAPGAPKPTTGPSVRAGGSRRRRRRGSWPRRRPCAARPGPRGGAVRWGRTGARRPRPPRPWRRSPPGPRRAAVARG